MPWVFLEVGIFNHSTCCCRRGKMCHDVVWQGQAFMALLLIYIFLHYIFASQASSPWFLHSKGKLFFQLCNLQRLHKSVPCICRLLLWWLGISKTIAFCHLTTPFYQHLLQGWHRHTSNGRCVCVPWLPDKSELMHDSMALNYPCVFFLSLCSDWPLPPTSLGPSPPTRQHRCMASPDNSASFHEFGFQ